MAGESPPSVIRIRTGPQIRDLGNVAILPGLINAHTHLELSWLRGRVPPASKFTDWVKTLVGIRAWHGAADHS